METRLLKTFRAIARAGGLARAAKELHVTPSALSHSLKALEHELGCRLFERVGNRLVLNQTGEQLLAGIEAPLRALEKAATSVRNLKRWGQSQLRIGAALSLCQHLLPPVIWELRRRHDRLQVSIESGHLTTLLEPLRNRQIDLALGVETEPAADVEFRPLFEDELLFVFAPTHPWAELRQIPAEEIRRHPLILPPRQSPTAVLIDQYFQEFGIEPIATIELTSVAAMKELVKRGAGVGILPPWAVEPEVARGGLRMRPLGSRSLRRRWVLALLLGRRLNLAEEHFCQGCIAQAASLRKDRQDLPAGLHEPPPAVATSARRPGRDRH